MYDDSTKQTKAIMVDHLKRYYSAHAELVALYIEAADEQEGDDYWLKFEDFQSLRADFRLFRSLVEEEPETRDLEWEADKDYDRWKEDQHQ